MNEEMNPEHAHISQQLIEMADNDRRMTIGHQKGKAEYDPRVYFENIERLKEIVEKIGWPTISKVGQDASHSAWLVVQHADFDVEFQEKCLNLMSESGDVNSQDIAFLTDRVAVNKGGKQSYGTQFYMNEEGKVIPRPIKDREGLNKRREEMGLEPYESYAQKMRGEHNWATERKFLQPGKQTEITSLISETATKIEGHGLVFVENANRWISENLKGEEGQETKSQVFRKRTATQIIEDGYSTGCTDDALVFISLARSKKIPTKYVEAVKKDSDGSGGHVFAEVFIDGEWITVDPARRSYQRSYKYEDYDIIAKGLDSWDAGTGSAAEIKAKTAEFRKKSSENQ